MRHRLRDHRSRGVHVADAAEKLSSAIGRKITYVDTPLEASTQAMLDGGAPAWLAEGQAEQFRYRWQGKQCRVTSTIADIARKSPVTFEDFACEYAPYFRGEMSAQTMGVRFSSSR